MNTENYLKEKLTKLYENDPYIHIDVNLARPHIELNNVRVKIVVYISTFFKLKKKRTEKRSDTFCNTVMLFRELSR